MYIDWEKHCSIAELIGKTITEIHGMEEGSDSITFTCTDGEKFAMLHVQDCCESVSINDVEGEVSDLIDSPIVIAEEVCSDDYPAPSSDYVDSYTWTFYRLATVRGFVVLRWLGESNGYYSEGVDFGRI